MYVSVGLTKGIVRKPLFCSKWTHFRLLRIICSQRFVQQIIENSGILGLFKGFFMFGVKIHTALEIF